MNTSIAWIDAVDLLHLTVINEDRHELNKDTHFIWWDKQQKKFETEIIEWHDDLSVQLRISEPLPLGEALLLKWGNLQVPVYPRAIVRSQWFEQHYTAPEVDLGAVYEKHATTFTLWAPTAHSVVLFLDEKTIKPQRKEKGIWQIKVSGDFHGVSYIYEVKVNGRSHLVNDPYAKAMLANSEKAVVVNLELTDPPHFRQTERPKINHLQDSIIYELHIRDATSQTESGVVDQGKFLGLTEQNTTTPQGYSTGLSYIKELGVTHVQLLPLNDFARVDEINPDDDYNWGYDPLFFQVPEGSYATSVKDSITRIKECKQMILAFHEAGLSVILDVVYNHVYIIEESAFELIVPGYYFRYHEDGTLSDGTGVGNDFASERRMARKFILETVDFWLKEYRVDGFRFDLMGIIDNDTMRAIDERCQQEDTPIMLLGEGWNLATALPEDQKATIQNSHQLPGIRFFNDYFRDTLKGNLFDINDLGFANGNGRYYDRLASLMTGSAIKDFGNAPFSNVTQTINFVEVHDNLTLWDHFKLSNAHKDDSSRRSMHQLATGIVLLSQGVPFIHAGQEWFRTKGDDGNSYRSGDRVNQLDWKARETEVENIAFVKALISLRKKYRVFRLTTQAEVVERFYTLTPQKPLFGMILLGDNEDIVIYINPTNEKHTLQLPSSGQWQIAVTNHPEKQEVVHEFLDINAYELIVLLKSRQLC